VAPGRPGVPGSRRYQSRVEPDQPIRCGIEVRLHPRPDVVLLAEQHHLALPADPMEEVEHRRLPGGVALHGHVVEDQRAGLALAGQVFDEGQSEEQVDLLARALRQAVRVAPVPVRRPDAHLQRLGGTMTSL
jgi:hypothetical protein